MRWIDTLTHSPCGSALASLNIFVIDSLNKQVLNSCVHLLSRIKPCVCPSNISKCVFLKKSYVSAKNTPLPVLAQTESFNRKSEGKVIYLRSRGLAELLRPLWTENALSIIPRYNLICISWTILISRLSGLHILQDTRQEQVYESDDTLCSMELTCSFTQNYFLRHQ